MNANEHGSRASESALAGPRARLTRLGISALRRLRQEPLMSLTLALAAGFVIGGGLSFRAGRMVLATAARQAGREFLKQVF